MNSSKLEKMQQWQTVMTVMGFELSDIMDHAWNGDEEFMDTLINYRALESRRVNQEPVMQAVMRSLDMGVTEEDIEEYNDYLEKIEEVNQHERDQLAISNNDCIKTLHEIYQFEFVKPPARYPNHICFKFNTADGTIVNGRCFRPVWSMHRIWTTWRDKANRVHKQKWEPEFSTYPPKTFPTPWVDHRATGNVLCYMMAYYMTTPKARMPESHLVKAKR